MGSERSKEALDADGLPSAGVSYYRASPEQLQVYRNEAKALAHFKATVSPLVHTDHPHEKLFVAAFDGTSMPAELGR